MGLERIPCVSLGAMATLARKERGSFLLASFVVMLLRVGSQSLLFCGFTTSSSLEEKEEEEVGTRAAALRCGVR